MHTLLAMPETGHRCATGSVEDLQSLIGQEVAAPSAYNVQRLAAKLVVEDAALVMGGANLSRLPSHGWNHWGSCDRLVIAHAERWSLRVVVGFTRFVLQNNLESRNLE